MPLNGSNQGLWSAAACSHAHTCRQQWQERRFASLRLDASVQVSPNVLNSVPREARVEIDIRDIDAGRRDATVKRVLQVLTQAAPDVHRWFREA